MRSHGHGGSERWELLLGTESGDRKFGAKSSVSVVISVAVSMSVTATVHVPMPVPTPMSMSVSHRVSAWQGRDGYVEQEGWGYGMESRQYLKLWFGFDCVCPKCKRKGGLQKSGGGGAGRAGDVLGGVVRRYLEAAAEEESADKGGGDEDDVEVDAKRRCGEDGVLQVQVQVQENEKEEIRVPVGNGGEAGGGA